jgi:hypothetical protein
LGGSPTCGRCLLPDEWAGTPEGLASLFVVHLGEAINEIPFDTGSATPDAEGVEWVDWTNE